MSLDLHVYTKDINDSIIPAWISQMNQLGMSCEIDPSFSFRNHTGLIQFKIIPTDCPNRRLNGKSFHTGFWLDLKDFHLNQPIEGEPGGKSCSKPLKRKSFWLAPRLTVG